MWRSLVMTSLKDKLDTLTIVGGEEGDTEWTIWEMDEEFGSDIQSTITMFLYGLIKEVPKPIFGDDTSKKIALKNEVINELILEIEGKAQKVADLKTDNWSSSRSLKSAYAVPIEVIRGMTITYRGYRAPSKDFQDRQEQLAERQAAILREAGQDLSVIKEIRGRV